MFMRRHVRNFTLEEGVKKKNLGWFNSCNLSLNIPVVIEKAIPTSERWPQHSCWVHSHSSGSHSRTPLPARAPRVADLGSWKGRRNFSMAASTVMQAHMKSSFSISESQTFLQLYSVVINTMQ